MRKINNMIKDRKKQLRASARDKRCPFCVKKQEVISWQDYEQLKEFLSARGRITGKAYTGVCARHQKKMAIAIKQARHLALLPFVVQE